MSQSAGGLEATLPPFAEMLRRSGMSERGVGNACSRLRRIEAAYPDLIGRHRHGGLTGVLDALTYSKADERAGRGNRSRIPIDGDLRTGLASLASALRRFDGYLSGRPTLRP